MFENIRSFLLENIQGPYGEQLVTVIILAGIVACAVGVYYLCSWLLRAVERLVAATPTDWDDDMVNPRFLRAVAQLAPAIVVKWMLPGFFGETEEMLEFLSKLTSLYILWAAVRIVTIFISNVYESFLRRPAMKMYAVKGVFQMLKLIAIAVGVIIGISILNGQRPGTILATLGASAAVLSLVFKDTILGFVASIQLTANKMLHRGDWIVVDKAGVNGEVIDITLTSVKVRNWDNSVSTLPPYSLISDSFRNYEPMQSAGARRICRAIYVDVNSVRYCTADELAELERRGWLEGLDIDTAGRVVNLQLFRRYLENFIANHPKVRTDLIYMVRQLDPTPSGLPVELYFFSSVTSWKEFEHIQAEVFDHVYALVALFGLRIFQTPAGSDLESLGR